MSRLSCLQNVAINLVPTKNLLIEGGGVSTSKTVQLMPINLFTMYIVVQQSPERQRSTAKNVMNLISLNFNRMRLNFFKTALSIIYENGMSLWNSVCLRFFLLLIDHVLIEDSMER